MNGSAKNTHIPPCVHFGSCGGCSLQHLPPLEYQQYKNGLLQNIVQSLGLDLSVLAPMVSVDAHSRRRVEFKVALNKKKITLGFYMPKSHQVVDLSECTISETALMSLLPTLKACLETLKKPGLIKAVSVTVLDSGYDLIITSLKPLKDNDQAILLRFAEENDLSRLYLQIEGLGLTRLHDTGKTSVTFGDVAVSLPVGAFLQATKGGEAAITDFVTDHLGDCRNVADLYAGCGTYSFPLSEKVYRVSSFEGAEEVSQAMHNAVLKKDLIAQVTTNCRDLFKKPLRPQELAPFDGIVINPPRNGALPQIKNIGESNVEKLVMVYCNPSTFKRDLGHIIGAGYRLVKTAAIDQFLWSNHLETVAYLEKIRNN